MNWKEFKQKAKEFGYVECEKFPWGRKVIALVNEDIEIAFYRNGIVECEVYNDGCCGRPFAWKRTIKQMYQLMEALK